MPLRLASTLSVTLSLPYVLSGPRPYVLVALVACVACNDPTTPGEPREPTRGILFVRELLRESSRGVHAIDLETGGVRRLTPPAQWVIRYDVSPDGRRFAYTAFDHQGFFVRTVDDTSVTRIATQFTGMALPYFRWSPDGSSIAFQGGEYPDGEIGVVDVTTGRVTRLTNDGSESIDDADPDWSPDGSRIVWTHGSWYDGFVELWTMRPDGSDKRRLPTPGGTGMHPRWSPLGDRIAYDNEYGVFTIRPDGSDIIAVTPGCDVATGSCSRVREFGYPVWSHDGQYLAMLGRWSDGYDYVLSIADANGASLRDVDGLVQHSDPDWSPDDNVLAFTGAIERPYENAFELAEIFVTRPDLSDLRALTNSDARDEMARWHW